MVSCYPSQNQKSGVIANCTAASTFEKARSLKFGILFGEYQKALPQIYGEPALKNAFNYLFAPGQVFGFSYESTGQDFKKFHHTFVLRSCSPGDMGAIIPGILPGAEILVKALTSSASIRLKKILQKLEQNKLSLSKLSISYYHQLNRILATKNNANFFMGELIEQGKKGQCDLYGV